MSNQIKLTIDISDELLGKAMQMMMLSGSSSSGGMPLMAMLQQAQQTKEPEEKTPIGFGRQDNGEKVKETAKEE